MSVTFRCKISGNCVSFEHSHDIEQMRVHPGYEEVVVAETVEKEAEAVVTKKRGSKTVTSVGN